MQEPDSRLFILHNKLVDDLYVEAMVLADEARAYLEREAVAERDALEPMERVNFSCESLKITTRLMQVIAWLLGRRAMERGEIDPAEARSERYRLGDAQSSELQFTKFLPDDMRILIVTSESLYLRAQRLEDQLMERPLPVAASASPARDLMMRLETAF